jgi:hypothetical protein
MDQVRRMPLDEVVIFDADENTVELPVVFNDLKSMPEDVVSLVVGRVNHLFYGWETKNVLSEH